MLRLLILAALAVAAARWAYALGRRRGQREAELERLRDGEIIDLEVRRRELQDRPNERERD